MAAVVIRAATESDVGAFNAIYNGYIVDSHVSFDTAPWTDEDRLEWLRRRRRDGYPVLVADLGGKIVGASWSGPWRDKAAYRGSVETTVVLAPGESSKGYGSMLYERLLDDLEAAGFHMAIAVIALPNDGSIALHRKFGYREVGVLDEVGHKEGAYHHTMLMQRRLGDAG